MKKLRNELKHSWENTFYRATTLYITVLITILFGLQIHQCFSSLVSSNANCGQTNPSFSTPVPVVGVLFDVKS